MRREYAIFCIFVFDNWRLYCLVTLVPHRPPIYFKEMQIKNESAPFFYVNVNHY